MRKKNTNKRQFTLIELIIVIVVIGILAGMALPKFLGVQRNAKVAAMEQDLDVIEKAVMQYVTATDDGSYPFLDTNGDTVINEEDLFFKTNPIPQTLKDSLLKASGDDGSKIYKLDMDKLKPYISKIKYPDTEYLYSEKSDTAIDPIGKADGDNFIHHIIGSGNVSDSEKEDADVIKFVKFALDESFYGLDTKGDLYIEGSKWSYASLGKFDSLELTKFESPDGGKVVDFDFKDSLSMVLTDKNNIYMWGYNGEGALGNGTLYTNTSTPTKVLVPEGVTPKSIHLGWNNGSFISTEGDLYVWGRNYSREVGIGSTENVITTPQKLTFDNKIVKVFLGDYTSAAIDELGQVFVWGDNVCNNIGEGSEYVSLPRKIDFGTTKIKDVIAVNHQTTFTDIDNNVYILGNILNANPVLTTAEIRALGVDLSVTANTKVPIKLEKLKPYNINYFYISNGGYQMALLDTNGKFYIAGKNYDYGTLGLGEGVGVDGTDGMVTPDILKDKKIKQVVLESRDRSCVLTSDGEVYYTGQIDPFEKERIYEFKKLELRYSNIGKQNLN